MPKYDTCRKCDTVLSEENIQATIWIKPYCPACWPSECPECGEEENYHWSIVEGALMCDNGCLIADPTEDEGGR